MPRKKTKHPGMWLRGKVWYSNFKHNGRQVRERLSTDFKAAQECLRQLRARLDRGDFSLLDNDYEWDKLKVEFLAWVKRSTRSHELFSRHVAYFEKFRRVRTIKQIDAAYVTGYQNWRLSQEYGAALGNRRGKKAYSQEVRDRRVSPRTVNQEISTLRNMLSKGVEWGKIATNPLAGVRMLEEGDPRKDRRPLTAEEVVALFQHSAEYLKPVWRTFAVTGMRHKELVKLVFSDIDFEERTITVRATNSKSKKLRRILIDDETLAMLAELKAKAPERQPIPGRTISELFSRDHVFVGPTNMPMRHNLLGKFYAACKRAGIEDAHRNGSVDIHSLRVTYATHAMENGASPKAVQETLGHSTLALTMNIYTKVTERSKRKAVEALPWVTSVSPPAGVVALEVHNRCTNKNSDAKKAENKDNLRVVG